MIFNYLVRKREQRKKQLEVNVAGVHSTAPTPGQDRVQQVSAQDKQGEMKHSGVIAAC